MNRFRPKLSQIILVVVVILTLFRVTGLTSTATWETGRQIVEVDYVLDGDTFDTTAGQRIRLLGIDAPEIAHKDSAGEPFGPQSTEWLRGKIQGRKVKLTFDKREKDHYGRILAWVWVDDELINESSLRTGNARLLDKFGLPVDLEEQLRAAEADAQVQHLGLWK